MAIKACKDIEKAFDVDPPDADAVYTIGTYAQASTDPKMRDHGMALKNLAQAVDARGTNMVQVDAMVDEMRAFDMDCIKLGYLDQ